MEMFDAAYFDYNPREAEMLDPQHRVLLECAVEAFEDAGYDPERFAGRVSVYAGVSAGSYITANLSTRPELVERVGAYQVDIGNHGEFVPTTISFKLNLKGPSVNVQTACSTSLVAVHAACQSLLNGESDMALAGGGSVTFPHKEGYLYQEEGIMSPDGHCRAFDAGARGTVSGEGAGLVVLKRLADALEDGDRIHAVIKGSAVNNDGSLKVGYTAPSVDGQAEVISEALALAGVEPDDHHLRRGARHGHAARRPHRDRGAHASLPRGHAEARLLRHRLGQVEPRPPGRGRGRRRPDQDRARAPAQRASAEPALRAAQPED